MGEYLLRETPAWEECREILLRASCPFGGGLGGGYEEVCGVLSGVALALGVAYGRVSPTEDDSALYAFLRDYRERFAALYGSTQCRAIRDSLPEQDKRCLPVVVDGAKLLAQMLDEAPLGTSRA